MKLKFALILYLTTNFISAQLSVSNSNYLYSNDIVIYVEDDVNLENSDSHIYLRNESQLIQGTGTTGNSGVGRLSTYQNGTVHDYAYNYWCSPVGNIDADNNVNRPFRSNNQIYDVTSAPITSLLATYTTGYNGTSSPLVISNRWLYTYDPGTVYNEWDFLGNSGSVLSGLGFTMKGTSGSGNNQLYDFRGKPNNGTISNSVVDGSLTLVGNPYPSALDAVDYIHDVNNVNAIDGTLYYWEQDLSVMSHYLVSYVGGYATYTITSDGLTTTFIPATFDTYNGDGTLNTTGASSSSGKQAKRYIPVAQGFMIKGSTGSTGTVRTTNAHRGYYKQSGADSEFFRVSDNNQSENEFSIVPEPYKRFRLNIDFNNLYTRQLVQTFHFSATDGFDYGLESQSLNDVESDAFWTIDDKPYVAQAFKFNTDLSIPLVLNIDIQQSIRIRILDIQNFNNSQAVYLHDKETNVYYDLKIIDFQTNLEAGIYDERFEITFKNGEQVNDFEIDNSLSEFFGVFQNNVLSRLTIKNPELKNIKELSLFDVTGKLVINNKALVNNSKYNISTKSLSNGTYIVILTTDEKTLTKKIIIQN